MSFLLKDFPEVEIIQSATNGLEAVKLIERLEPDLVFLDVQMPGLDGLGVIAKCASGAALPHFILTTAFDQYAVEAFRLEALDYLLKPMEKERLAETVARARRMIEDKQRRRIKLPRSGTARRRCKTALQRTKLLVRATTGILIVDAQDLIYATIDDGMITVVTTHFEGQSNYRTIEELQSNLDPNLFGACTGLFW